MTERKKTGKFTAEERAAMQERAQEVRKSSRGPVDNEPEVLAKIAEMERGDRAMAERIHAIVRQAAPELTPRLWYGQPAYARDGKVVLFFQPSQKFKTRYSTLGFSDEAMLDSGDMWPTAFALRDLNADDEARIAALVKQAAG
jgi:uncharacterized protein YdhG (YjbR/CyaY superfamily)